MKLAEQLKENDFISLNFISHMVQMKHTDANITVDSSQALYPTWFRWNILNYRVLET